MSRVSRKSRPLLWEKIVKEVKNGSVAGKRGTWNARKAQLAVQKYKDLGGGYIGRKSRSNSLSIWTKEDWGYIDNKPGNRYLPKAIRDSLTTSEKISENKRKRSATRSGKQRAKYSRSVSQKLSKSRKSKR